MSGEDLLAKVKALGFEEFLKEEGVSKAMAPVSGKTLDWIFAFPKVAEAMNWVLENTSSSNVVSVQELKSFQVLETLFSLQEIEEHKDLLRPQEVYPDCFTQYEGALLESLSTYKEAQTKEILSLKQELSQTEEPDYMHLLTSKQTQLNTQLTSFSSQLKEYLSNLEEFNPLLPLSTLNSYVSDDEYLSTELQNHVEEISKALTAISVSPHRHCLNSHRAAEYTDLKEEETKLQSFFLKNLNQEVLAKVTLAKYQTAMETFENLVLREAQDIYIPNQHIESQVSQLETELLGLEKDWNLHWEQLPKGMKELGEVLAELGSLEECDEISIARVQYQNEKLEEVLKVLDSQQKRHLLGLSGILLEQENVQSEYEKLFEIKNYFQEIAQQTDFRCERYKALSKSGSLEAKERMLVDERDQFLNNIYKALSGHEKPNLELSELLKTIQETAQSSQHKDQLRLNNLQETLQSILEELRKLEKAHQDLRTTSELSDFYQHTQSLQLKLEVLESKLNSIHLKVQSDKASRKQWLDLLNVS